MAGRSPRANDDSMRQRSDGICSIDLWDTAALHRASPTDPRRLGLSCGSRVFVDGRLLATAETSEIWTLADRGPRRARRVSGIPPGRELEAIPDATVSARIASLLADNNSKLLAVTVSDGTVRFYDVTSRQGTALKLGQASKAQDVTSRTARRDEADHPPRILPGRNDPRRGRRFSGSRSRAPSGRCPWSSDFVQHQQHIVVVVRS